VALDAGLVIDIVLSGGERLHGADPGDRNGAAVAVLTL